LASAWVIARNLSAAGDRSRVAAEVRRRRLNRSTAAATQHAPLALGIVLAFAATSLPLSAVTIAIGVYLPQYFARNLGVELGVVGAAFALIRLIDIPLDPLLGLAMDRTKTRWGRYRIWTVAGAPVLMAA